MLIENILGIDEVDAASRRVSWHVHQDKRHGLRNLRFGDLDVDLISDGDGNLSVASNGPFTLVLNGEELFIDPCSEAP
jgi:hypothetical protein